MTVMAVAVERDAASQRKDSKRAVVGRRRKSFVMQRPVRAEKKCPPMRARGWARGTSILP
jgi:hypothetical protein